MFPILLNLMGRRVVVVGGGAVGARKALAVLAAGATVQVIDPRPLVLPTEAIHIREPYRIEHLDGAALVFACAPAAVNACVVADAKTQGVWVNAASSPDEGDFTLPAVVRRDHFTLAVSTEGASPALARRVREKLETEYDATFGEWVKLLAEVRAEVRMRVPDEVQRRELLNGFADWSWLERLRAEGVEKVGTAMRAEISARPLGPPSSYE